MEHLKYPIGKFEFGKAYSSPDNQKHISIIEKFPQELKTLVAQLSPGKLEKSYRPNGWTARQIIHHIADSHMNAYIRTKWTLTEDAPIIKAYNQDLWANLEDSKCASPEVSLPLIEAIHQRWVYLLKTLTDADLQKKYIHPEQNREFKLDELLALYAWHGKQHYEHLNIILKND
ncbi:MAG: putative metal-dependent hydrolase [Bacteroidetes bacterium]|nr:putative metal-dependent hydrolase [Bacteroidota bacterium]